MPEGDEPKGRKMNAREKSARAVELYKRGYTYEEIAAEVGYRQRSGAYRAVERAIAEQIREPAEHVRRAEVARLDMLLKAAFLVLGKEHVYVSGGSVVKNEVYAVDEDTGRVLMETDENGNRHPVVDRYEDLVNDKPKLEAIDRILKIMKRRAELLGLDAPAKFEAVHPDLVRAEIDNLTRELGFTDDERAAFDAEAKTLIERWADNNGG